MVTVFLLMIMLAVGVLLFVFWLKMLIDALKYQKEDKLIWVLLIIFLHIVGALIYFFVVKSERTHK